MNQASDVLAPLASPKPRGRLLLILACVAVVIATVSSYLGSFLVYLRPYIADWLGYVDFICAILILVLVPIALLRRQWRAAAIFVVALLLPSVPVLGTGQSANRLVALSFRIHASPFSGYLSKCDLVDFVEKGVKQTVGTCESRGLYRGYAHTVIYDTTGSLLKPEAEKSPEWKRAMDKFYSEEVLATSRNRTLHIFGDFYSVGNSLNEERG